MPTTHPTREDLERELDRTRVRHRAFLDNLEAAEPFGWLREQWQEERERCRRDLETCDRKELATLQVTIGVLGRVLARSSLAAFEADVVRAEEALAAFDNEFPLFREKEAAAKKPAPTPDPLEEHDDGNDGGAGMCSAASETAEDAADAPNWVTGDQMTALIALGRGNPSKLQHEVDTVAPGWLAQVIEQTSWPTGGARVESAKLTAYCPSRDARVLGQVSAPDLATLCARVEEADKAIDQAQKVKAGGPWAHGKRGPVKGAAKRERARKAAAS